MKEFPIHQNLSTSFVDLPALVRHLRGFQFVGTVHLELSNYEARIIFDPLGKLIAEEIDHGSGRMSRGTETYQRIVMRSRESHGYITVLRNEYEFGEMPKASVFIENAIARSAKAMANSVSDTPVLHLMKQEKRPIETEGSLKLARLLTELLETFDDVLTKANLNFAAAFRNASAGMRKKHPFLDPEKNAVGFKNGKIKISITAEPMDFAEAVADALTIVLARLKGKRSLVKPAAYLQHRLMMHKSKYEKDYSELGVSHIIDRLING